MVGVERTTANFSENTMPTGLSVEELFRQGLTDSNGMDLGVEPCMMVFRLLVLR